MLDTVTLLPEKVVNTLSKVSDIVIKNRKGILVSYSLPCPKIAPIEFLRRATNAPRIFWASAKEPSGFTGYDIAAILTAHGPDRFKQIHEQASDLFKNLVLINNDAPPEIGPRLFGGFSFQVEGKAPAVWSAFPAARFVLPRYQLSWQRGESWLTMNYHVGQADDPLEIAWLMREEIRKLQTPPKDEVGQVTTNRPALTITDLMDATTWQQLVSEATQRIRRGELDKVVLARARHIRASQPLDIMRALKRLARRYPDCYRFLFEPIPGHTFYGATPELLAEVTGPKLNTAALAGSIRRGDSPAEDEALGQELMSNPKERHEHALVVEAIQEHLQPLVTGLSIAPQPGLCRLSNIQHLRTTIEGILPEHRRLLAVVEALHPTPALGGRPRHLALSLINQAESVSRGWYGAPIGWIDWRGNGLFAVAIRSAISVGAETLLYAGAGIVADSIPEKEWQETELKFNPLMEALETV